MLLLNSNDPSSISNVDTASQPRLMLFDLSVGGHHPGYIQHLIRYWCEHNLPGSLDIVVVPKFLTDHADVVEFAASYGREGINFVAITPAEVESLNTRPGALSKAHLAFQEWGLLCKYAALRQVNHVFLMYFDTAIVPFIFGQKPPCPISGIYFRPTLHYHTFGHYQPTFKDKTQVWREYFNLSRIVRRPQLETLFCLDPFSIEHLQQFRGTANVLHLADPIQVYEDDQPDLDLLKQQLGIQPDRQVFLFFGALTARKGIDQVLDAIPLLPPDLQRQICLLLVGPLGSGVEGKQRMRDRLDALSASTPVQIVVHDEFVSDRQIQPYFHISDVILAPYQRHVGMSAILVRAAMALKPVLAPEYGLMGEVTRRYQLGLTVDSSQSDAIAQGLTRFLTEDPTTLCDRSQMQHFGSTNSSQEFARVIFEQLSVFHP